MDKTTKSVQFEIADDETNAITNELLFADDQNVFYENEEQLQAHATSLNECLGEYDMRINIGKTETKCVSRIRSQLNHLNCHIVVQQIQVHLIIYKE